MSKIALCIITNRNDSAKAIALVEEYLDKKYIDEFRITIADKDEAADFQWVDDFSAARNFNFSQTKADWILWLDSDDTLEHPERLRQLVDYAELNGISGYFVKYKYGFDERGNCIDEHWKLQLVKNDGHAEWAGAVHEDLLQKRAAKWVQTEWITRVHHTDGERIKESNDRNLRILLKSLEKNPKDARTVFYIGREYVRLGELQTAVDYLTEYLTLSGWDDERYEANMLIGECLRRSGQLDEALLTYNAAILEKETLPDAYIQKAICYMKKEKWNEALYNFKTSLGIPADTNINTNPMMYSRDVYAGIAVCYMQLGRLKDAQKAIQIALKSDPKNKENLELASFIQVEILKYETAQKYVEIAKFLQKPEKIQHLLTSVPASLADNEMILSLRNTYLPPKKWKEKSIAIYCGVSAETWTPDSLIKGGIGGSETAVIELGKRLTQLGWDVTVYNQCEAPPEGLEFDGVHYRNYWTFNIHDEFDVLWVWRLPEMFDYDLKARLKILDIHDTMSPNDFTDIRVKRIDKIFAKTNFHRSLYPKVPDEKFVIIGNGIDLSKFENTIEPRDPYRFIYASSPNRGLDVLLEMWPKIKEKLPKATLHVFYGWKTFYELEKNNPERMMWMKHVQELMKQDGVVDHGRVDQKTLAKEELKSSYWLYPTFFPEIDCITAKEMQAAKVCPITSGYAALEESQGTGVKLHGDVYDPEWQKKYIEIVVEYAKTKSFDNNMEFVSQFSWDNIADKWNDELCA